MMNLMNKKPDVTLILEKLHKPSENSAESIKSSNEEVAETPLNSMEDEITNATAQEHAASALAAAFASKDSRGIISAMKDLMELLELDKDED